MISVSYLKSKHNKLDTIKRIDESKADFIHVDLMDGLYVENKNFTIEEVIYDLKDTNKSLDIHLMVNNPIIYIDELAKLKPSIITFHLDSTDNPKEVIELLQDYNIKVGIAINPDEDINILNDYYELIDYVLIMSVHPGLGGQSFIPSVLDKVNYLEDKNLLIGIDGGINNKTRKCCDEADIIISGSFICMSDDYNKQIDILNNK